MGRIHAIGACKPFTARPTISIQNFAIESREFILQNELIPMSLLEAYKSITHHLIQRLQSDYTPGDYKTIRLHGDCHPGNILVRYDHLFIVDLDDARNGPAIQDIWMMLNGDRQQKTAQLSSILEGYEEFYEFDYREFRLIEVFRCLRMLHYSGWLAKRWEDPAFPQAFPWFNTENYWASQILELKEQLSALDEEPLKLQ